MSQSPLRKLSPKDGLDASSLLRTLIDSLPEQVFVKDAESRYILSNIAYVRALGAKSPEEIAGKSDSDFYPRELVEQYRSDEQGIFRSGQPLVDREEQSVDEEGNERWHSTTKLPLRDDSGKIVGLVGITWDVTERKRAETELQALQREHQELIDSVDAIIWRGEARTLRFTFVSHQAEAILGYPAERWTAEPSFWADHIHPEDRAWAVSFCTRAIEEKRSHTFDYRMIAADGSEVWFRDIVRVAVEGGVPTQLFGVMIDITERKEAEEKLKESEKRFRSLIQNASDVITVIEEGGIILYESPAIGRVLGYRPEERIGKNAFDYLHPDDREQSKATFAEALNNPGQVQRPVEFRLRHKDGSWRTMESTRTNLLDDPAVKGVVANSRDITERRQAEEALRESEERFRSAFEDAPIGVALVSLDRRHLKVNRAYCEMLGYPEEELLEKPHPDLVHPVDRQKSADRIHEILEEGAEPYPLERRYVHADGDVVWSLSNISLIRNTEGEPSHFVCLHQDITERKELEEQLRYQAFYDSLTDLPNRLLFLDRLEHALARAGREGGPIAVLLVDLDDFKAVNDSLGHDAGNAVLAEVAGRLRGSVRPGDTVGRIFGDEFTVLLEAPSGMEEARQVAVRIQEGLQAPLDLDGQEVFVRASIGISLGESAEDEPKEVLRHADLAMYAAKKRGMGQYEVYNPRMDARAVSRMGLEKDLRQAIEREEFEVHYQPKVLLETGAIVGVEALVRWRHPDRELLPPTQFIPYAEKTGLINQIGLWVLRESSRQTKEWQERYPAKLGPQFRLCVNLSAREIQQPDLAQNVAGVLRETELDPHCLMVEITERTAMEDTEQTIAKLRELKELGVKLAIDDFGTGYCSLVYLEHSLLDVLKIDRVLIHRQKEDWEECVTTVSAMVSMAQALGLAVIVEGVEDEDQVAELKKMGCEMAQGFYFAKPLSSESVERLLVEGGSW
jgi:diguanylate cyclase (GGDEF)-like protein/PAS domain S-box-containing protein